MLGGLGDYGRQRTAAEPAIDGVVVTPSDVADLAVACRSLYISVAGALKITTLAGNALTIPNVVAGHLNVGAVRVFATGTAATGIVALY